MRNVVAFTIAVLITAIKSFYGQASGLFSLLICLINWVSIHKPFKKEILSRFWTTVRNHECDRNILG